MKQTYFRKYPLFFYYLLSLKEKWKLVAIWKKHGKILQWDICYSTHLGPVADALLTNSSPSEHVLTELVHSKYTALLSVVKDGKTATQAFRDL